VAVCQVGEEIGMIGWFAIVGSGKWKGDCRVLDWICCGVSWGRLFLFRGYGRNYSTLCCFVCHICVVWVVVVGNGRCFPVGGFCFWARMRFLLVSYDVLVPCAVGEVGRVIFVQRVHFVRWGDCDSIAPLCL
jgi:hypothetical protein